MSPLKQLEPCRQSPWLDYLKHTLIESGDLPCPVYDSPWGRSGRDFQKE